jgi:hypothetical protein
MKGSHTITYKKSKRTMNIEKIARRVSIEEDTEDYIEVYKVYTRDSICEEMINLWIQKRS